ncbi:hypothetical protein JKP88DRAFT_246392 [Tribonema minus]|uniref:Uncharacterized protein n=1 Tax=Tribonema minus TaxID=303371 RepID=A0A835YT83_9STRA|nr:hypothetical protein JKP88DRAFT_246392 [Tribonema minus]
MEMPPMRPGPTRFHMRVGAVLCLGFIALRVALLSGCRPGGAAAAAAAAAAAVAVEQRSVVSRVPPPLYAPPATTCPRDNPGAAAARSAAAFSASTWTLHDYAAARKAAGVPPAAACAHGELSAAAACAAAAAGSSAYGGGCGGGGGAWLFASDLTLLDYLGSLAPLGFTLYPFVHPRTAALYTLLDPLRASYGACAGGGALRRLYAPLVDTLPRALPPPARAAAAVLLVDAAPLLGALPLLHLDPNLPAMPTATGDGDAGAETWRQRRFWFGWLLGQRAMGADIVFIALVKLICLTIASWRCYARLLRGAAPQLRVLPISARCARALRTRADWYLEDMMYVFVFHPCLYAFYKYRLSWKFRLVMGVGFLWMEVVQMRLLACVCALLLIAPPPLRRTRRYAAARNHVARWCHMRFGVDFTDDDRVDKMARSNW